MKKLSLLCKSAVLAIAIVLLAISIDPVLCPRPPPPPKPVVIAHVKSCNSTGYEKDTFLPNEDVYCKIWISQGDIPLTGVRIYIVYNDEWHGGGVMTDRSDGYETVTITPISPPEYHIFKIWSHTPTPLTPGQYDIVVDEDHNGIRDGGDKVDDSGVDVGFFVIPELPLGTLMAIMASLAAIGLVKNRQQLKR